MVGRGWRGGVGEGWRERKQCRVWVSLSSEGPRASCLPSLPFSHPIPSLVCNRITSSLLLCIPSSFACATDRFLVKTLVDGLHFPMNELQRPPPFQMNELKTKNEIRMNEEGKDKAQPKKEALATGQSPPLVSFAAHRLPNLDSICMLTLHTSWLGWHRLIISAFAF